MSVMQWLFDSDPAIRWQVMHNLAGEPEARVNAERARVATEGWGARLLQLQGAGGYWGGPNDEGWMTTHISLLLLKELGVDPDCEPARTAVDRVEEHLRWWQLDGRRFFDGETEACINGKILAAGAYFGRNCDRLVDRLLGDQLPDGGWNCAAPPSRRSSFHSTICVLEGLLQYEKRRGAAPAVTHARNRAQDYVLDRRMIRSLHSGEVIDPAWTRFAFPTTWHYDVLRGMDYLCNAGVEPDERVDEAVGLIEKRRDQNGRWPLNVNHQDGRVLIDMEVEVGKASRWNTLRALRVLKWYRNGASGV